MVADGCAAVDVVGRAVEMETAIEPGRRAFESRGGGAGSFVGDCAGGFVERIRGGELVNVVGRDGIERSGRAENWSAGGIPGDALGANLPTAAAALVRETVSVIDV